MKTLRKIMMAMFAIATIGMTVACQKSDSTDDGHGDINASIVGTWRVDRALLNDNIIPEGQLNLSIVMNENGTGQLVSNGLSLPIEESHFTWSLNGTNLKVKMNGTTEELTYTVTTLTATKCVIQGTVVPGYPTLTGDVRLDLSRDAVDPEPQPEPEPEPEPEPQPQTPDEFPGGTQWTYSTSGVITVQGQPVTITLNATLAYATTGHAGTLNVVAGATMGAMPLPYNYDETIDFTYTFDATSNTGTMTGAVPGAVPTTFPYTYNPTDDVMIIALADVIDEETLAAYVAMIPEGVEFEIPEQLILTRVPAN